MSAFAIWPEKRTWTDAQLITAAKDAVANGEADYPFTDAEIEADVKLAISILDEAGLVTFSKVQP